MNIKDFNKGNTETVNFLESATELKKLKRYYDAEHVKRYIGAAIHSSYSIGYLNGDTFIAIDPNKTVFSSEDDIELYVFGNANLNEAFVNTGAGNIVFAGPGSVTIKGESVYGGNGISEIPNASYDTTGGIKMSRDSASNTTYISFDDTDTPNVT
jgi:hypothetical protein